MKRNEIFELRPSSIQGDIRRLATITQAVLYWLEKKKGLSVQKAIDEFGVANAKYLADLRKDEAKAVERRKRADAKLSRLKHKRAERQRWISSGGKHGD